MNQIILSGQAQAGALAPNVEYMLDNLADRYGVKVIEFKSYGGFLFKGYRFKIKGPEQNVYAMAEELQLF